jgi:hypothetical protein
MLISWLHFYKGSVVDSWHFGTDPDPGISASDQWIRIRFLLFSFSTFKRPTSKLFFS